MGNGGKLKRMMKLIFLPCTSFCSTNKHLDAIATTDVSHASNNLGQEQERPLARRQGLDCMLDAVEDGECAANVSSKNFCTICLEPLLSSDATGSPGQAVFTSQCSHSFHLSCISSNIRHGSMSCPICRAHWTALPQTLHPPCWVPRNSQPDPVIRILDDSISTFRVHRRFFTRTARYNDDDPVEAGPAGTHHQNPCGPRLLFGLVVLEDGPRMTPGCYYVDPGLYSKHHSPYQSPRLRVVPVGYGNRRKRATCLSVRLAPQQPVDLVLVASPNGPHLRLLKQCMSLAVCSLRDVDRLAIVSYSSAAARVFPLRRMTSCGKRAALQVIDRLFYAGHGDPVEGIKKGIKILKDRAHENPHSSLLHLSDYPTNRSYRAITDVEIGIPVSVRQFHVGSTGSIVHELEEYLHGHLLGGAVREVQLSIGGRVVRLGDLRGDEERRVFVEMGETEDHVRVSYTYTEGGGGPGVDEDVRVGEAVVGIGGFNGDGDRGHQIYEENPTIVGGRASCVDAWEFHDPYMARRWAKRLHGRHRI